MPDPTPTARSRRRATASIQRALACAVPIALAATAAADETLHPECAQGVCAATLAARLAGPPCADAALLVAWAEDGGATLVQCGNAVDGNGNRSYLFDRGRPDGRAVELRDARVFAAPALARFAAGGVPGAFGVDPLCKPPGAARAGQILLLAKTAAGCLRVLRADTDDAGVALHADDGRAPPPAPAPDATARWHALVARVQALVPPAPAPAPAPALAREAAAARSAASAAVTAAVSAPQAWLFDVPEPGLPSHNWLDRGTRVTVLDTTRDPAWVKIRYVGQAGRPVERWVHRADLAIPG